MDFDRVTEMLSKSYWCTSISKKEVIQGATNSALNIGCFVNNLQISYARVISDKTRFAYILDVYVDEDYRKRGIGHKMIKAIIESDELKDVYQWILITKDAHEVYRKVGFSNIRRPESWMEIRKDRPIR